MLYTATSWFAACSTLAYISAVKLAQQQRVSFCGTDCLVPFFFFEFTIEFSVVPDPGWCLTAIVLVEFHMMISLKWVVRLTSCLTVGFLSAYYQQWANHIINLSLSVYLFISLSVSVCIVRVVRWVRWLWAWSSQVLLIVHHPSSCWPVINTSSVHHRQLNRPREYSFTLWSADQMALFPVGSSQICPQWINPIHLMFWFWGRVFWVGGSNGSTSVEWNPTDLHTPCEECLCVWNGLISQFSWS